MTMSSTAEDVMSSIASILLDAKKTQARRSTFILTSVMVAFTLLLSMGVFWYRLLTGGYNVSYYTISDIAMYFGLAWFIIGMIVLMAELAFNGKFHDAVMDEFWHLDYAVVFLMELFAAGGAWPLIIMFEIVTKRK